MDNKEVWLILYHAILADPHTSVVAAATQADLAMEQYLDRFASEADKE